MDGLGDDVDVFAQMGLPSSFGAAKPSRTKRARISRPEEDGERTGSESMQKKKSMFSASPFAHLHNANSHSPVRKKILSDGMPVSASPREAGPLPPSTSASSKSQTIGPLPPSRTVGPMPPSRTVGPMPPHKPSSPIPSVRNSVGPIPPSRGVGPALPPRRENPDTSSSEDDDSNSDDDEDEETEEEKLHTLAQSVPSSHQLQLRGHEKAVTALALDPKCARLISGSSDYSVKMWNFAGMDSNGRSFRSIEPCEGHQIRSISYNPTGSIFVVAAGDNQARLYDRDGHIQETYAKGDPYIADMKNTKGHVSSITHVCFDPTDGEYFLTSSQDSTLRTWHLEESSKHFGIIKVYQDRARRISATTCSYYAEGRCIAAACNDGTLQMWNTSDSLARPHFVIYGAHEHGSETTSLAFTRDNHYMISRGGDDTLKIWDLRMLSSSKSSLKPHRKGTAPPGHMHTIENMPNYFATTDVIVSPNDDLIVTGTSSKKGEGSGLLCFYRKGCWTKVRQIGACEGGSVVSTVWNEACNQIAVGGSDGIVRMYYDPEKSTKGAILAANRKPRPADPYEYCAPRPVHAPHSAYGKDQFKSHKRKREQARKDPILSKRPDPPTQGPDANTHTGSSMTQHLVKGLVKQEWRSEDPREALLKYAGVSKEEPYFMSAYQGTQPEAMFTVSSDEEEEDA